MHSPFFSLIIPVYNTEKYLNECFHSVKEQSFKDYEAIIIDDGSPGLSGYPSAEESFLKYFSKDERFRFIKQKNRGVSSARNEGLNLCSGRFIKFVDSDDILAKEHLKNINEILLNHNNKWNNTIFYLTRVKKFITDKDEKIIFTGYHTSNKRDTFLKELVYFGMSGPKLLIPKNIISGIRFLEGLAQHEEPEFYLRIFLENRRNGNKLQFVGIEEDGYYYRLHDESFTEKYKSIFDIRASLIYGEFLKNYEFLLSRREKLLCRLAVLRFAKAQNKSFIKQLQKKLYGLLAKMISGWYC